MDYSPFIMGRQRTSRNVVFGGVATLALVLLLNIENFSSIRKSMSTGSSLSSDNGRGSMTRREVKSLFVEHMNRAMSRDYSSYGMNHMQVDTTSTTPEYTTNNDHTTTAHNNYPNNGSSNVPKFVIGIFSMDNEKAAQRRQLIRDTYLTVNRPDNLNDPRVCSLLTYLNFKNNNNNKKNDHMEQCVVLYVFVIGGIPKEDETQQNSNINNDEFTDHFRSDRDIVIHRDAGKYQDVVFLNIKENMNGGKSPTFFKWVSSLDTDTDTTSDHHTGIQYVSKCDDDTMLYMPALFQHIIYKLPPAPYHTRIYGGKKADWYQCGQYKHCESIIPHGYNTGMFFFLSVDLARDVSSDHLDRDYDVVSEPRGRHFEDMDMGRWIFKNVQKTKLPITMYSSGTNVFYWLHPIKETEEWTQLWNGYEYESTPYICAEGHRDPQFHCE